MTRNLARTVTLILLVLMTLSLAAPAAASPVPSKAASRDADLAAVKSVLAHDEVARALAATGLTDAEIQQRLERLSQEDLRSLASNLEQVKPAGTDVPEYIWWLLGGLLAVLILVAIF